MLDKPLYLQRFDAELGPSSASTGDVCSSDHTLVDDAQIKEAPDLRVALGSDQQQESDHEDANFLRQYSPQSGYQTPTANLQPLARTAEFLIKHGYWRLRFPADLEADYIAKSPRKMHLSQHRALLLVGIVCVVILGFFDTTLSLQESELVSLVRYGFLVPILFAQLLMSFVLGEQYQKIENVLTWIVLTVSAVALLYVLRTTEESTVAHYHGSLLLLIIVANLLTRFKFWQAFTWTSLLFIVYFAANGTASLEQPLAAYYAFLVVILGVLSLTVNYQIDHATRGDYLHALLLETEKEKLEKARGNLYHVAVVDSLTGLYNRRHFDESLAMAWRDAYESQKPISLLFIDIDCFKRFNDTYGHLRGDQCLKVVGDTLKSIDRRASDIVARYGGEEFVIILPSMNNKKACEFADNIRSTVAGLGIPHRASSAAPHVTVSVGVSTMVPGPSTHYRLLVEFADIALYEAKDAGRNQVCNRAMDQVLPDSVDS